MGNSIRLSDFILNEMESLLKSWESFARTINPPALTMDSEALRDHAEVMLRTIAYDLTTHQTEEEQAEKSKDRGPRNDKKTPAEEHARLRLSSGFTIEQLISEYRALRASVLHLWEKNSADGLSTDTSDITRFNEGIDQAIAESVAQYSSLLKNSQHLFLAILGHDLRNPLSTSIMASSFIMRSNADEKCVLAATRIFNSSQRMTKLVDDLIDYTRTQLGGKLPIVLTPSNVCKICTDVVEEHQIAHPHRKILMKAEGSFEGMWDKNRIAQVFSNILGNAVQHGAGDMPIGIDLTSSKDAVAVAITNGGKPIPKEKIAQIFEPFVRFAEDENRDYNHETSLGIGLYIANEIVEAHQGAIKVESSPEKGTVFEISLPRQSSGQQKPSDSRPAPPI